MDTPNAPLDNVVDRHQRRGAPNAQPVQRSRVKKEQSKRTMIAAACEECRNRKARCDGGRPDCSRCIRSAKTCSYSVNPGETRQAAAKFKTENLQKEYDSMLSVLDTLRSNPLSDAQSLLGRLRASQDAATFAKTFRSLKHSESSESSATEQAGRSSEYAPRRISSSATSLESIAASPDRESLLRRSVWQYEFAAIRTLLPAGSSLPPEDFLRKAVQQYYNSSGSLFHVFEQQVVERNLDTLFRGLEQNKDVAKRMLCEVCCVAAAGICYLSEPCREERSLYDTARVLLVEDMQSPTLGSAKCCTLLGMFHLMNKATLALAYIELGMDLCRRHQIHVESATCPPGLSNKEWMDGKRTWKTLLFLGSWISSTLGYVTSQRLMAAGSTFKDIKIEGETQIHNILQTEMVKIAILKQDILRINYSSSETPSLSVETIRQELQRWYRDLPGPMRLSNLLDDDDIALDARISVYMVHLLYLGALMLIYRQILRMPQQSASGRNEYLDQAYTEAVTAAAQSSRILHILQQHNGLFQRCWMVTFQSWCAGTVILHGVAQDLARCPNQGTSNSEALEQARRCIDILHYCGEADPVAARFHTQLQSFYEIVCSIDTQSQSQSRSSTDPRLQSICDELFAIAKDPVGHSGVQEVPKDCDSELAEGPSPFTIITSTELGSAAPQDGVAADSTKRDGSTGIQVDTGPATFLHPFASHDWADYVWPRTDFAKR